MAVPILEIIYSVASAISGLFLVPESEFALAKNLERRAHYSFCWTAAKRCTNGTIANRNSAATLVMYHA